jgi:hypothetical protein
VSYCYYKLVTNIIGAVKINVLSCPWYTVWYTTAVSQSALRAQPPSWYIFINHSYCEKSGRKPPEEKVEEKSHLFSSSKSILYKGGCSQICTTS